MNLINNILIKIIVKNCKITVLISVRKQKQSINIITIENVTCKKTKKKIKKK